MEAGLLRRYVRLEAPVATRDSMGTKGQTFAPPVLDPDVYARIQPLSGDELWKARQASARTTHKITIRYREDVDSTWRVVYQGRVFQLDSAPLDDDERNETMTFLAIEIPRGSS